ncbi:hypothetical protein M0534_08485 [Methylonatrum kenyense]|uniref:hypothetical protein n=1 Tax=Methylonatrum kenyense TaxID=455253 RepID=UPI0020BDDC4E|nr:hypothetical protein [Methylonatrum kenyense]MCK8516361.1 hypothetical protein [Methylonatrum kenyense]
MQKDRATIMLVRTCLGTACLGLLTACSDGDGAGAGTDVDRDAITEGLSSGDYEISVDGSITQTGAYEGDRGPYDFAPASDGTNAEGPYLIRIRTETERDGDQRMSYLMIVLPAGAETGRHQLTANRDAGSDDAYAMLRSYGQEWTFAQDVSGHVDVAELGDVVTAAYEVELHDGDGNSVALNGRMVDVPFQPQAETDTRLTLNGDEHHFDGGSISTAYDTLRIGPIRSAITIDLPDDGIEPGTYELTPRSSDDGLRLSLRAAEGGIEDVNGSITFEQQGDTMRGSLQFTASGPDDEAEAEGTFEGLEP